MSRRLQHTCGVLLALAGLALACRGEGPHPHQSLSGLWRKFQKLPPVRALAVAGDPERIWVAGAAGGLATEAEARAAALEECQVRRQDRRLQAPCRIYAVGKQIVW